MQPITVNNVVSYAVMIDAPNDDLKLLPGMNADISIIVNQSKNVIKIPVTAMNFFPPKSEKGFDSISVLHQRDSLAALGKSLVFVLDSGRIIPVTIQTGLSDGIKEEVMDKELTIESKLIVGIKQDGINTSPQTKGLIQTPQRTPRIR